MLARPTQLNLSNWRQSPYNRWSFHHVREVIPSEKIKAGKETPTLFTNSESELGDIVFDARSGKGWPLSQLLEASHADAFLVAHQG